MVDNFDARLKQANITKSNIDHFVEKTDFCDELKYLNKKFTSNKTKHVEKKLTDLAKNVHKYQKNYMICKISIHQYQYIECILETVMVIRIF